MASARGFGLACAHDGRMPVIAWLPFHIAYGGDGTPSLTFHVARANPIAAPALRNQPWLIAVSDADAYVSPRWYASPQQVPTWLYKAVNLAGPVRPLSDQELIQHLDLMSAQFEAPLQQPSAEVPAMETVSAEAPWSMAEIAAGRRAALLGAITGFAMTVEQVEGSFKLNQHKSDADHLAIVEALAGQADAGAQKIASDMRGMRPNVFAAQQPHDNANTVFEGNTA
jgi:transcriptional regulator